jgi:hypothetical protein
MLSKSPTKDPKTRVRGPNSKKRMSTNEVMKANTFCYFVDGVFSFRVQVGKVQDEDE